MLKRLKKESGFTFMELLVVLLILTIFLTIIIPTFLGQTGKAKDNNAKTTLVNSFRTLKLIGTEGVTLNNGIALPANTEELIDRLSRENPSFSYKNYEENGTSGDKEVSVLSENGEQASLCVKSSTGQYFCGRFNYFNNLFDPDNPYEVPGLMSNNGASYCVRDTEEAARACLTNSFIDPLNYYELAQTLNPLAGWSLGSSNGLKDLSGNGHDLTNTSNLAIGSGGSAPTQSGSSGSTAFTGGSTRLTANTLRPFVNGAVRTYTGWIYRDNADSVMTFWGSNGVTESGITSRVVIRMDANQNLRFYTNVNAPSSYAGMPTGMTPGNWYFVAIVHDQPAHTVKLYINGDLKETRNTWNGEGAGNYAAAAANSSFTVGSTNSSWVGRQAGVFIYNRGLSDEEISSLYQAASE